MRSLLLTLSFSIALHAGAQKAVNAELYYYPGASSAALVPVATYTSAKNWTGAVHYNWEDDGIASVHGGKKWDLGKSGISVAPMGGVLFGRYTGLSLLAESEWEKGKWYAYTAPQYCFSPGNASNNFYYSWSEARFYPADFFSVGLALQQTKVKGEGWLMEPGALVAFSKGSFELPVYLYRSRGENYWVLSLAWSWAQ